MYMYVGKPKIYDGFWPRNVKCCYNPSHIRKIRSGVLKHTYWAAGTEPSATKWIDKGADEEIKSSIEVQEENERTQNNRCQVDEEQFRLWDEHIDE